MRKWIVPLSDCCVGLFRGFCEQAGRRSRNRRTEYSRNNFHLSIILPMNPEATHEIWRSDPEINAF